MIFSGPVRQVRPAQSEPSKRTYFANVRPRESARGVNELSENEIRVILRGADDIVGSGGRGLLGKILKGSKQKAVLEHALDQSPVYGALSELSLEQITARIDWLIINRYLDIEYDYRLPLLVYAPRGWEIERETYANELLDGINRILADSNVMYRRTSAG